MSSQAFSFDSNLRATTLARCASLPMKQNRCKIDSKELAAILG
jgi:hypothetical protein